MQLVCAELKKCFIQSPNSQTITLEGFTTCTDVTPSVRFIKVDEEIS